MIDRNHPAVEAANKAVKRAYGSRGGEALNYHATALRAALPHLTSATEENLARLRNTPAVRELMADAWMVGKFDGAKDQATAGDPDHQCPPNPYKETPNE